METASASRSASSGSGSASGSGFSLAPLVVSETCSYLAPDPFTGCREARTCESCLETAGCMIDDSGLCVDKSYNPSEDFRLAIQEGLVLPNASANYSVLYSTQRWQFPSGALRYCNSSDSVCRSCTRNNFWRSRNSYPDSRFCLGEEDACVCVDVCERRWFVTEDCLSSGFGPSPSSSQYYVSDVSIGQRLWHAVVGAIVFVVVILLIMVRSRRASERTTREQQEERQRRHDARRDRRNARAATLGVNSLNLSGWETHRRDLISKEMAQLSGEGDVKMIDVSERVDERADNTDARNEGGDSAYVRMEEASETHIATVTTEPDPANLPSTSSTTNGTLPTLAPVTSTRHHRSSR